MMTIFDGLLKITVTSTDLSTRHRYEFFKLLVVNIFHNVTIDWIDGGLERGHCYGPVCSNFHFKSVQSGLSDLNFPPSSLEIFNRVPDNITISPVLSSDHCKFMNYYTRTSAWSLKRNVLSSFNIIKYNVYILIFFSGTHWIDCLFNSINQNPKSELPY